MPDASVNEPAFVVDSVPAAALNTEPPLLSTIACAPPLMPPLFETLLVAPVRLTAESALACVEMVPVLDRVSAAFETMPTPPPPRIQPP